MAKTVSNDKRANTKTIKDYLTRYDAFIKKCREVTIKQLIYEAEMDAIDARRDW